MLSFFEDLFSSSDDVETLKAKRNVRGLIRALKNDNQNIRNAALEALGEIGDPRAAEPVAGFFPQEPFLVAKILKGLGTPGFEVLLANLHNEEVDIRWAAAKVLGETGDPRVTEPLLALLQDPNKQVREVAVDALGRTPDARVVAALTPLLHDPDVTIRQIVIETLGKAGGAPSVALLTPALLDTNWSIRQSAAEALEHVGWAPAPDETGAAYWAAKRWWSKCVECGPHALRPLTLALNDHPFSVAEAMEKLGALALPPLMEALRSPEPDVRRAAAKSLGVLKEFRSLEPLCAALQDSDTMVRQLAVAALGQIGSERALEPLLAALLDDTLREPATKALRQLKGELVVPALLATLQSPNRKAAQAVLGILNQLQDRRAVKPLLALLQDPEPEIRWAAIEALGRLGDPQAVEPLLAVFQSGDTPHRVAAAQALGQIKDSRVVPVLIAALGEPQKDLQAAIGDALGKFGPQSVGALVAALANPALRYNAADALVKVGGAAVAALLPLMQHSDVDVRHTTIEVLGLIGDDRAMGPLIAALKDEAVRYSAAEALWKIGVSPELKSVVTIFRDKESSDMLAALRALCDAYILKDNATASQLETQVRHIGVELSRRGGVPAMRRLFDQLENRDGAARVAKIWVGIGDWQA